MLGCSLFGFVVLMAFLCMFLLHIHDEHHHTVTTIASLMASDRIFVLQIARFVVLTGPAADEILELHFVRLMVFAGPACDRILVFQIARFAGLDWACRG